MRSLGYNIVVKVLQAGIAVKNSQTIVYNARMGVRTTAKLVSTERASHPLVMGGIWVTQASIPTGMNGYIDEERGKKALQCRCREQRMSLITVRVEDVEHATVVYVARRRQTSRKGNQ